MKTTSRGLLAEAAVANSLKAKGHQVITQNWRTKNCEVDLITKKGDVVYFTEVKFRGSDSHGDGFDYVTPTKLRQMEFAARMWCSQANYEGDWRLAAAAVTGDNFQKIELLEI